MKRRSSHAGRGFSANASELRTVFVTRVHQLLQLGYERLESKDLSTNDEPSITGFLANEVMGVLDNPPKQISEWCTYFYLKDDPPENTKGRTGKRRKRVDVLFESSVPLPRPKFRFEAKRLSGGHNVKTYLGETGLGCFLDGDYGPDDPDAGMLAYIQSDNEKGWSEKISKELMSQPKEYSVSTEHGWKRHKFPQGPAFSYRTHHSRRENGSTVVIYHSLLAFLPKTS